LRADGIGYEGKSRFYTLQSSTSLAAGSWGDVPGFIRISSNNQTVTYQTTTTSPGFFRATVWMEDQ